MKTERASKLLLGFEALAIAYPTGLGLLMMAGAIAPAATGSLTLEHALAWQLKERETHSIIPASLRAQAEWVLPLTRAGCYET